MTRHCLVVGLVVCFAASVRGQDATPLPAGPIAQTVERLGREILLADSPDAVDGLGRPVFRATTTADAFVMPPMWVDTERPATGFRPRGGTLHHHQFLADVTPEAFRGGTLYPGLQFSTDPGEVLHDIKALWRGWQSRRARERIERELEELRRRNEGTSR